MVKLSEDLTSKIIFNCHTGISVTTHKDGILSRQLILKEQEWVYAKRRMLSLVKFSTK
jgi:hypothetical protein